MPMLGGLELLIAKPLFLAFCKLGASTKVAMAISAGTSVVISAAAIKKATELVNREYGVDFDPQWVGYGKAAIQIAVTHPDFISFVESGEGFGSIKGFSAAVAKCASDMLGVEVNPLIPEIGVFFVTHCIGDEKKLGFA